MPREILPVRTIVPVLQRGQRAACRTHLKGMIEDGDPIPEPSGLDDLTDDPAMRGAVVILVGLESAERSVRVNITARQSRLDQIDRPAAQAGMSRSPYMVRAATSAKSVRRHR